MSFRNSSYSASSATPASTPIVIVIGSLIISTSTEYVSSISVSTFVQNGGVTLTLGGSSLSGVAISASSVTLSGDLVLDVSGLNVYNGMTIVLVNSTSITGQWQSVVASGSSSECTQIQVHVHYTSSQAVASLTTVSLCSGSFVSAMLLFILSA
jgi:hypothetical protein